jgi:dihydroorotate dehydrogenase electron transfer subunit
VSAAIASPGPLAAKHYADGARFVAAAVVENVPLAEATYRLRIAAPSVAERITPGQFVMLRVAGLDDPLLGRAFALYDVVRDPSGAAVALDVVYLVHGKMTSALARLGPGATVEVWGPLGNGFEAVAPADDSLQRLLMVAGGIGQTPFLALGKEALGGALYGAMPRRPLRAGRVELLYGVRRAALAAGIDDFRAAEIEVQVASDDGSIGRPGMVTGLLACALDDVAYDGLVENTLVVSCGPEPMMRAVAELCAERGVRCRVSLETPMACGVGACFSCVARVVQPDGSWDYKRTCVEGPVFDADQIVW